MKRGILVTIMLLLLAVTVAEARQQQPERKKVGLVLSGGGAKGVAHVGVIKVLEEAGIPIDYIAGTSMGSIVGGLYAIGYTSSELDSLFRSQNWIDLLADRVSRNDKLYAERQNDDKYILDVPFSGKEGVKLPAGLLAGQNVLNMLNDLTIGYHNVPSFDNLPVPFACVSYDMVKGREYVARSGSLPTAIRASMAIPGAFTPVQLDSMILVDGGVKNNFPVDVVLDMGADIIIGVDVGSTTPTYDELNSVMGLVDQMLALVSNDKFEENKSQVDLYLRPEIEPYGAASFTTQAIDSLLVRGERVAREHYDEILALKEKIGIDDSFEPQPVRDDVKSATAFYVGDIVFDGLTGQESHHMMDYLGITPHSITTRDQLNDAIMKMRGSGSFSYVAYMLDNQPPYNLTIYVTERERAALEVGFRFDSEELAAILVNTSVASIQGNIYSPKIGLTARLSGNPYVKLYLDSGRIGLGSMGVSYMFRHNDFTVYEDGRKNNTATFNVNQINVALSDIYLRNFNASIGARYEHFSYNTFLFVGDDFNVPVKAQGYLDYFLNVHFETLDDAYYPTRGTSVKADYTLYTDNGLKYNDGAPFSAVQYSVDWASSLGGRVTLLPSIYGRTIFGDSPAYPYLNYVGGHYAGRYMTQQMPFWGVNNVEIFDNSVCVAALGVRTRLWKYHYLTAKCNYALSGNSFFHMFDLDDTLFGFGLEYSYKTPIGPLMVEVCGRDNKFGGIYLGFGKYF